MHKENSQAAAGDGGNSPEQTSCPSELSIKTEEICFGLNRELDQRSLAAFLQKIANPVFLGVLLPRLDEAEFLAILDFLSRLMHKHLSEEEYHRFFLGD